MMKTHQFRLEQDDAQEYDCFINKIKRPPTEWERIFANNISNKRLISKINKELIQLNIKKNTD